MSRIGVVPSGVLGIFLGLSASLNAADPLAGSRSTLYADLATMAAQRPTPEEFQQRFPDLWLVMPGDIVERSTCSPYQRFIARVDIEGRIVGGLVE